MCPYLGEPTIGSSTVHCMYCVHACIVFCYLFAVQSDVIYEFYIVK